MPSTTLSSLKIGQKKVLPPLPEGVDSCFLATRFKQNAKYLLLTQDTHQALRLKDELLFFKPELTIAYFPDWEILPYDRLSPHQDIVS